MSGCAGAAPRLYSDNDRTMLVLVLVLHWGCARTRARYISHHTFQDDHRSAASGGPNLVDAISAQICPIPNQIRQMLASFGQNSSKCCPNSGTCLSNSGRIWSTSSHTSPKSVKAGPILGEFGPNLDIGRTWTKFGPMLGLLWSNSAQMHRFRAEFGQNRAGLDGIRPWSFRAKLAPNWPQSRQMLPEFGRLRPVSAQFRSRSSLV